MNIDFPVLLVAATFFTGFAWAFDALVLAPQRRRKVAALVERGASPASDQVTTTRESVVSEIKKIVAGSKNRSPVNHIPGKMVFAFHEYTVWITLQFLQGQCLLILSLV